VDTAYVYGNEESVGKAIRESGIRGTRFLLLPSYLLM